MLKWKRGSMTLGLVLLLVAVGLCLFHGAMAGTHHDEMSPDICAGLFLMSFAVTLLYLAEVGALSADRVRIVYAVSPHLLDPPPKLASLA